MLDQANAGNTGALINPFGGLNQDGDCNDSIVVGGGTTTVYDGLTIAGTAFATATADSGAGLEQLATTHTATSGYNAFNGLEVDTFNQWYLPIVQTNCGPGGCWNSIVRIANLASNNSAVTVRFFPADDGSGSLQTGFQLQELVQGGETWNIDISDWVPQGWVGAVHIYSDGAVFAMVDRYKAGYNMWITNTGSSADFENGQNVSLLQAPIGLGNFVLYAPHVLVDYFGWNTGINVANLVEWDNNVSIQYFNMLGNATQGLSQRLSAHGMTYFYDPSDAGQNWSSQDPATDPNAGVVASALIWSDYPVAAVIDATKYPETDPRGGADVFQATSYSATRNLEPWQAVPYVTKGNPTDGSGATSGINFMNPNPVSVTIDVFWVNPSGFNASNFGISTVSIPAYANGFVYTLWQHNLPNGFTGAAVAIARDGIPVVAASANVNYDVEGDGAVIYNSFNPCGFFRVDALRVSELQDGPVNDYKGACGTIRPDDGDNNNDPFLDLRLSDAYLQYLSNELAGEGLTPGELADVEIVFTIQQAAAPFDAVEYTVLLWPEVEDALTNDSEIGLFFADIPDGNYQLLIEVTDGAGNNYWSDNTNSLQYLAADDEWFGGMVDSDYIDSGLGNASELVPGGVWDWVLIMQQSFPRLEHGYPAI